MYYFDIGQVQQPGRPSHQIDPLTRPIEQGESGVWHHDAERDPGEPDPGADIEDETGIISKPAGKEQRVADVSIVDTGRLVGADATGFDRFGEKPFPIPIQRSDLVGRQLPTRPFRATGPEEMGLFHVKQITPVLRTGAIGSFCVLVNPGVGLTPPHPGRWPRGQWR